MTRIQRKSGVACVLVLAPVLFLAGCASQAGRYGPSEEYSESTAKSAPVKCPAGLVLSCESKTVGRIRFGRIGNQNLESCACEEYRGMPTQSPVPGLQ